MKRNISTHTLRNLNCLIGIIMLFLIMTTYPVPICAQGQRLSADTLFSFVEQEIGLSSGEMKSVKNGRVVTKKLGTDVKHEVAMFSIARIDVSADVFLSRYGKDNLSVELVKADSWGLFSDPPQLADVQQLTVPSTDIGELKKSNVGDSKVKGPADLLDAFRQLDSSASDYQQQADALLQRELLAYAEKYAQQGAAGMLEYADKKKLVSVADQFQDILTQSPYLTTAIPELPAYLTGYPQAQLPNATSQLFWMIENFGGQAKRPTITVNHRVSYQPEPESLVVASKQLYANHYYEAGLGLTVMVKDPDNAANSVYLLHISRSRIDALRDVPKLLAGDLYKGAEDLLDEKMTLIKQQIEAGK